MYFRTSFICSENTLVKKYMGPILTSNDVYFVLYEPEPYPRSVRTSDFHTANYELLPLSQKNDTTGHLN